MSNLYDYIPKLPPGWNPQTVITRPECTINGKGNKWTLEFPTKLKFRGIEVDIPDYAALHYFIKKLFKTKPNGKNI